MKAELSKIRDILQKKLDRAAELAESDNEATAQRYEYVIDALNAAMEGIDEAIACFD